MCIRDRGILDAAKKDSKSGTVKIVAGLVTVLLGWTLVSITLYIVAALMILYCLMNLVSSLKTDGYSMSTVQKLRTYAKPVIGLAAGICLLLNQGGTVSWVFKMCIRDRYDADADGSCRRRSDIRLPAGGRTFG